MTEVQQHKHTAVFSVYFLSCLLSAITFYIAAHIVKKLSNNTISPEEFSQLFLSSLISDLKPEQDERNIFVLGCLLLPVSIYFYSTWIDKKIEQLQKPLRQIPIVFFVLVSVVIYYLLFTNHLQQESITTLSIASRFPFIFALGILIFSIFLFRNGNWIELKLNNKIVFSLLICGVSVFALSGSLMRLAPNNDFFYNGYHFSAVFNSVVMAFQGKVILNDIFNTYGLYPHILAPVFKIIGLTPQSFCIVMALLLLISLALLISVINNNLQNKWIKILGSIAIIDVVCFYRPWPIENDFYLQYVPIRILFPSLVLFFSSLYFNSKKNIYYYLTFFIACIAPLWNSDTGIVSLIAWYIALFVYNLATYSSFNSLIKQFLRHLATGFVMLIGTVIAFSLLLYLSTDKTPDFSNYLLITKLFYKYGYFMAKAPLWHVWMLYISISIAGVALCVKAVRDKSPSPRTLVLCVLTIITIGAFSYYQGRSYTSNLLGPGYLAILILIFLADQLWSRLITLKQFDYLTSVAFYICIAPVAFCAINYFIHQTGAITYLHSQHFATEKVSHSKLDAELKKHAHLVKDNEKTLVFSFASGSVHLFTNTQSFAFDSFSELFLNKDYSDIKNALEKKLCRILYVEKGFNLIGRPPYFTKYPEFQSLIDLNYHLIAHVNGTEFDIMEAN